MAFSKFRPEQRAAWQQVSEQNLQAAIEDLIRATNGDLERVHRTLEQTMNRVVDDRTWVR